MRRAGRGFTGIFEVGMGGVFQKSEQKGGSFDARPAPSSAAYQIRRIVRTRDPILLVTYLNAIFRTATRILQAAAIRTSVCDFWAARHPGALRAWRNVVRALGEFRLGTLRETPQPLNCNPRTVTRSFFTISMNGIE
jgi:hypothetical protein